MRQPDRRSALIAIAAALVGPHLANAQAAQLQLLTAGKGSGFLPFGEGLARALEGKVALAVRESAGSTENIAAVEADAGKLGFAFLGTAWQAINGVAPFEGKPHRNLRALLPMYDTSFHVAVKPGSPIRDIRGLDGKKVAIGPAGGPQEVFIKGLMAEAGIAPMLITGPVAELGKALLAGDVDAFWQGASVPIPIFTSLAKEQPLRVFGLGESELAGMLKRFPYLARGVTAPGSYAGQEQPILSISAWNVVIAHRNLPEATAYAIARGILERTDLTTVIGPAAGPTRAENAPANTTIAYHPGAARYLKERGVTVTVG